MTHSQAPGQVFLKNQEAIMFVGNRFLDVYHHAKEENSSTGLLTDILQCKEIVSRVLAKELNDRSQAIFDASLHRNTVMEQENKQMAKLIDEQRDQIQKQKNIIDEVSDQLSKQKDINEEAQKKVTRCRAVNLEWVTNYDKTSTKFQETNRRLEKTVEEYRYLLDEQKKFIQELEHQKKNLEQQIMSQKAAVDKTAADFQETNRRLEKTAVEYRYLLGKQKKFIEDLESKNKDLEEQITKQKAIIIKKNNQNIPPLPALKGLDCKICYTEFGPNRFPMISPCGHSLCKDCLDQLPSLDCPFCQRKNAYQKPAKNYLASEVLEEARRQRNYWRQECREETTFV